MSALPYLDEHSTTVRAGPEHVWRGLLETLDASFSGTVAGGYARLVGCADTGASGPRPLTVDSTLPGFHVVAAEPGRELTLEGSHRFASYALAFRIAPLAEGRCRLTALSHAAFPGVAGGAYRLLVLRTGAHLLGIRRLLSAARRRAESMV